MNLIPAIDLRHGEVVRLVKGDDGRRTRYGLDPRQVLADFAAAGVDLVHVVDLDAAFGEAPQRQLIAELAATDQVKIELGGGLRDRAAVDWALLETGCERVILGSLAAKDFDAFAAIVAAHPDRIVPAVEVASGALRIAGWTQEASVSLEELCGRLRGLPCPAALVTDVDRDGTLGGPNLELASQVYRLSGLPILVSGGIRSLDDLRATAGVDGVAGAIVGKALYEGAFTVEEALRASRPGEGSGVRSGLTCRVIPCLDVRDGRVVKGVQFENLIDQGDPAECAGRYDAQGADEIVFLDITAAPEGRDTDREWVSRTAEQVFIPLTVGGGVRKVEDAAALLRAGADKVAINTVAFENPPLIEAVARQFGSQCMVLSVDARRRQEGGWEVVTHGGRKGRGRDAIDWIVEGVELGAGEILLTSIDADGTQAGYGLELLEEVASRVSVPLIASGGAGRPEHLAAALAAGADAVLAASIFHQGTYTVGEVKGHLAAAGFPMRLEEQGT